MGLGLLRSARSPSFVRTQQGVSLREGWDGVPLFAPPPQKPVCTEPAPFRAPLEGNPTGWAWRAPQEGWVCSLHSPLQLGSLQAGEAEKLSTNPPPGAEVAAAGIRPPIVRVSSERHGWISLSPLYPFIKFATLLVSFYIHLFSL